MMKTPPQATAVALPLLPPSTGGLPVIEAGSWCPVIRSYSSSIQPMASWETFMSGAGMSLAGPMTGQMARM